MLGAELRRLRGERGLTLMELGLLTGYSWQHLGAVERGQVVPSEAVVDACERALCSGGRLAALFPAVVREQASQRHGREVARRQQGTPVPAEGAVPRSVDWARLAACARQQSTVTKGVVEELEQVTAHQRELYHELSSAQMLLPVEAHLGLLLSLLDGALPDHLRRQVASAAGEAAGFAAWLWFDLGDSLKAARCYRLADQVLAPVGNPALWSYVAGYRALVTSAWGLATDAAAHAEAAVARAWRAASCLTRSWLAVIAANAHAVAGEARMAGARLGEAVEQFELSQAGSREAWMYEFDQAALSGYTGACLLRLGRPRQARAAFEEALAVLPPGHGRRRALVLTGLAEAHLAEGEPDGALRAGVAALALYAERGSASGVERVRRLRDGLARAGYRHAAAELDEQARASLRGSA